MAVNLLTNRLCFNDIWKITAKTFHIRKYHRPIRFPSPASEKSALPEWIFVAGIGSQNHKVLLRIERFLQKRPHGTQYAASTCGGCNQARVLGCGQVLLRCGNGHKSAVPALLRPDAQRRFRPRRTLGLIGRTRLTRGLNIETLQISFTNPDFIDI